MPIPSDLTLLSQGHLLRTLFNKKLENVFRVVPAISMPVDLEELDQNIDGPFLLEFEGLGKVYFYAYPDDQGDHLLVSYDAAPFYSIAGRVPVSSQNSPAWVGSVGQKVKGVRVLINKGIENGIELGFSNNTRTYIYDLNDDLCASRTFPFDSSNLETVNM